MKFLEPELVALKQTQRCDLLRLQLPHLLAIFLLIKLLAIHGTWAL